MADWKYIMFENPGTGRKVPIIFPAELVHADMAEITMIVSRRAENRELLRPVSAGFLSIMTSATEGESESLGKKSRPEDALIINTLPYTGGVESGLEERIEIMLGVKFIEHLMKRLKQ